MPKEHDFVLISGFGREAKGESLDEIYWCRRCGTVRHDCRHNEGQTSPNYPRFYVTGYQEKPNSKECITIKARMEPKGETNP